LASEDITGEHPIHDSPKRVRLMQRARNPFAAPPGDWSPALRSADSPELQALVLERAQLREQLVHVKDLSTRLIDKVDEQAQRIEALESELKRKDAMIHDLEAETAQLIAHASNREEHVTALKGELKELEAANDELVSKAAKREDRISQLESFLKMIAEADRREE
jgi:predicted nuclease with TOPRIM domain